MKKLLLILSLFLLIYACGKDSDAGQIYLATNGVTIKCEDAY